MQNITTAQIEIFLAVANCGSCSGAAKILFISQSTISKSVNAFEKSLNVELFIHNSQGMKLTEEGEYLYSVLKPMYNDFLKAIEYTHEIKSKRSNALSFVVPGTYDTQECFETIRACVKSFAKENPDIDMDIKVCGLKEIRQAMREGLADFCVVPDFLLYNLEGIQHKKITAIDCYIAISINHPLAQHDKLEAEQLSNETFYRVSIDEDEYMRNELTEECKKIGFIPKRIEFVSNFTKYFQMIRDGKGVCIIGKLYNYDEVLGFKYYAMPELAGMQHITVAWNPKYQTKSSTRFVNYLESQEVL